MDDATDTGPTKHAAAVERLGATTTGVWLVRSRHATTHVWDLNAMTYRRQPGPHSSSMPYDNVTVPITRVGRWPEVGHNSLVFFDDPDNPLLEHWRVCSTIRGIVRFEEQNPYGHGSTATQDTEREHEERTSQA